MYAYTLLACSIKKNTSISVAVKTDRRREEEKKGWVRGEMRAAATKERRRANAALSLSLLRVRMKKDNFCEVITRENLASLGLDNEMCKTIYCMRPANDN